MSDPSTVRRAREAMEVAARHYAAFTHGNLRGTRYREREEAREVLRDTLAVLDLLRSNATTHYADHQGHRERKRAIA